MELNEAITKAKQILDEERGCPTVVYSATDPANPTDLSAATLQLARTFGLSRLREERPRKIFDDPRAYRFKSINYDLLLAILGQLIERDRSEFIGSVASRLFSGVRCVRSNLAVYPKWEGLVSELPLVTEFLVRNNGKAQLFEALKDMKPALGHVFLLLQLQEMIALNFDVFADSEYAALSTAAETFADKAVWGVEHHRDLVFKIGGSSTVSATRVYRELKAELDHIVKLCQKSRYLYLKASLLEGLNLEVNQDKATVEHYLHRLGYPNLLIESLNRAENLYMQRGTAFDLKNSLGLLRSFLEEVHRHAMPGIHSKLGGTLETKWGSGLAYLARNSLLSPAEEKLAASLYTLISDEGIHSITAEREYVRLARNMIIEYALLFLTRLDKLGYAPPT